MSSAQAEALPSHCRISELWAYPLKSGAGQALDSMYMDRLGPSGDRRWMLVDADGHFLTQRQQALMSQLRAEIITAVSSQEMARGDGTSNWGWPSAGLRLSLGVDGGAECLEVAVPDAGTARSIHVEVWGDRVDALDAGDEAAAWLSERFGKAQRLAFMPRSSARQIDIGYSAKGEQVSFSDGFPLLLINQSTVDALSAALAWSYPAYRMRPNLVISGLPALAENQLESLSWGGWRLDVVKPCSRCVIPSIEPGSSEKQRDVMEALKAYRGNDGKVYFGQNLILRRADGSDWNNADLNGADDIPSLHLGASLQLSYR